MSDTDKKCPECGRTLNQNGDRYHEGDPSELSATAGSHHERPNRIEIAARFIKDKKARDTFLTLACIVFPEASIAWDTEMAEAEIFTEDWSITFS